MYIYIYVYTHAYIYVYIHTYMYIYICVCFDNLTPCTLTDDKDDLERLYFDYCDFEYQFEYSWQTICRLCAYTDAGDVFICSHPACYVYRLTPCTLCSADTEDGFQRHEDGKMIKRAPCSIKRASNSMKIAPYSITEDLYEMTRADIEITGEIYWI